MVEDLNLMSPVDGTDPGDGTSPGDETNTEQEANGNGQDEGQQIEPMSSSIVLDSREALDESSEGTLLDYTQTTVKPIYGTGQPTIMGSGSVYRMNNITGSNYMTETYNPFREPIPGMSTTRYTDITYMHEYLRHNPELRNNLYDGLVDKNRVTAASIKSIDPKYGDPVEYRNISGFGREVAKGIEEMSLLYNIPEDQFYRELAATSMIQRNPKSQYTIAFNEKDYNGGFIGYTDFFERVISNNYYSDLLQYNFGESIDDNIYIGSPRVEAVEQIYNKTPQEFEQDIMRYTSGIAFNDRKDMVEVFADASPQDRVEIYKELFSLETELKELSTVMSTDDPVIFKHQQDFDRYSSEFVDLVSSGGITIETPEPIKPILDPSLMPEGLDPESAAPPRTYEMAQSLSATPRRSDYEIAYDEAKEEYISNKMTLKYGNEWKANYDIEKFAFDGINKVRQIMDRTGLSYLDVMSELNGNILPSLDPENHGDPDAKETVFDFGPLYSAYPRRSEIESNMPEDLLNNIRSAFIRNKAIMKSDKDHVFKTRRYTDDEAYNLAIRELGGGFRLDARLGEFDKNKNKMLDRDEAADFINSLLEDQAAEYTWLSEQKQLHEQLAVAAIVLNDNRELIQDEGLIDIDINGVSYKATPRQAQLYTHHMNMANQYVDRFTTFAKSSVTDVYGELAYIRYEDQIRLDEWTAENPKLAFLAISMQAITDGVMSGPRGAVGIFNTILAEQAYALGDNEAGDNFYEIADIVMNRNQASTPSRYNTGIYLSRPVEFNGRTIRLATTKDGELTGVGYDENLSVIDPRIVNKLIRSLPEETLNDLSLGSTYDRSILGFYNNGLKIGTQILSTVTGGGVAGMYGLGTGAVTATKMATIFTQSYDAQYTVLTEGGVSPRAASAAAAANSVFTTLTAQAFGVEFFSKASPIFKKVLERYSDDLIKAVAQADGVTTAQISTDIVKTIMTGAGLEFTQEMLDQIQKNVTKEILMGGNAIDGIPGLNETIDIAILSAAFGGAGAGATINISDFTTTQQQYFQALTANPAKLQSTLEKGVERGEITQEQANRAMVMAKEYIENTPDRLKNTAEDVRHQIVIDQININKDLQTANEIKDDAKRQEVINEINERQKALDERIERAVDMDTPRIYSFKADEIPAHLLNFPMRFNEKTGENEVSATKREFEQGYAGGINLIITASNVSDVMNTNAATLTVDPENNVVTVKVTDQYKGSTVTVYNQEGNIVSSTEADTETGEVKIDAGKLIDGGYRVFVDGQLDVSPELEVEARTKTESQIISDLDAVLVDNAIGNFKDNGVPITTLPSEEYDGIPASEVGVDPKNTKAMVYDGVVVIRENAVLTPRELYHEVSHWVLTNPDFTMGSGVSSVDFNTVIEALNSDPATEGIINRNEWEAFTRMYPQGQVSNETLANVMADIAIGQAELNQKSRYTINNFFRNIRDLVAPPKTTINQEGVMTTEPSRISLTNSQDITNTIFSISELISKGGAVEATSLVQNLPTQEGVSTPDVQATMKDSKILQDQVDAGDVDVPSEDVEFFNEVMDSDFTDFPDLQEKKERFAREVINDPVNLSTYLEAFRNDIDGEYFKLVREESNATSEGPDKALPIARKAASLPGHSNHLGMVALYLREAGDNQGAIEAYNQAIEKNPDSDAFLDLRADTKEDMGDVEGAKADREEATRVSERRTEKEEASRKAEEDPDVEEDAQKDPQEDVQEDVQETKKPTDVATSREGIIDEILDKSQQFNSQEFLESIPNPLNRRLVIIFNRDIKLDRESLEAIKLDRLRKINEAMTQALELESFNPLLEQYIATKSDQDSEILSDVIAGLPAIEVKLARSKASAFVRANANTILSDFSVAERSERIEEMINGMTATMIDLALGNSNRTDMKDAFIEPFTESTGTFLLEYSRLSREVSEIMGKLETSAGIIQGESNVKVESKYRVQAALLQLEFLLNPDNPNVATVDQYIDVIVGPFEGTKGDRVEGYNKYDIKILKQIKKDFEKVDMSSVDAYIESLQNIMSPQEIEVFQDMRRMYDKLSDYNEYISGTILGNEVIQYDGYVHHSSIIRKQGGDVELATEALTASKIDEARLTNEPPPTFVRGTGVVPINFDAEYTYNIAAKSLIEYANVAPASLLVDRTIGKTGTKLSGKNSEIFNGIKSYMANYTRQVLRNVSSVDQTSALLSFEDLGGALRKNAYRALLANTNRFADAISNLVYAMTIPEIILPGTAGYLKIWNSDMSMNNILQNVDCTVAQRIVPQKLGLGGKGSALETNTVVNNRDQARADMSNYLINILRAGKIPFNDIGQIADFIITAPDRPFAGPVWFGTMANEFNSITGQNIDWEAIHRNDPAYMNMFSNAIREARRAADENVTRMITQTGSLADIRMRINNLKNSKKRKLFSGRAVTEAMFAMSTFQLNDVDNLRKALADLAKQGMTTKANAARLLAATQFRQIAYYTAKAYTAGYILSLFARDDYEDEQGIDFMPDNYVDALRTGSIQGITSLMGIYDANQMTSIFISSGVNAVYKALVDEDAKYGELPAFGNKTIENSFLGVDETSTWEQYVISAMAVAGPTFNFYVKPFWKWVMAKKELDNIGTGTNPFTNRRRQRLENKISRLESQLGLYPFSGEYSGTIFGVAMPFFADMKKILNETASDWDFDMAMFEKLGVDIAESQYSQDLNSEIKPNFRYVTTVDNFTGEVVTETQEYNGYDEKATTRFNPETGKTEQAGQTWPDVESEVERRYNVDLNAELARILEARHGKKLDPTAITMSGGQPVYSIHTPAYLNTYGITMAQKNSAQRQANKNLGFAGGRDNELLRYDNNGEKGIGYDHLMDFIGSYSYKHFGVKKTVALVSNYSGSYGDADVYYTYEELNELKYEEYNLLAGVGNATVVGGQPFFTAGQVKELYESDIVIDAQTKEEYIHPDYDLEDEQQMRDWINDGFSSGLNMPSKLEEANDDDLLSLEEVSQLSPYGQIISKAVTELREETNKDKTEAEKKNDEYIFIYGDPDIHVGHSNFIQVQGELRIAGGFNNIPYPKTNYVNRYDATVKAP